MKIYLAHSNATRRELITQRLKLYNLPAELATLSTVTDSVSLDAEKSLLLIDQAETVTTDLTEILKLPWKKILRLGVDLELPGEEPLLYEILSRLLHPTRYSLILLTSGKSKSGCTKLATHPRLMSLQPRTTKPTLIRVNLLEDPQFRQRVKTPHTHLTWPAETDLKGIITEYLPAGEIVIDGGKECSAPSDKKYLAQILCQLSHTAPTVVDAGRISAELNELAVATNAKILLIDQRWKTAAETKLLAQKWEIPIIRSYRRIRELLAEESHA